MTNKLLSSAGRQARNRAGNFAWCLALLLCALPWSVWTAPRAEAVGADPHSKIFRQPDGSKFSGRIRGDEWFHWVETSAGHSIAQDAQSQQWNYLLPPPNKMGAGFGGLSTRMVAKDTPPVAPFRPKEPQASSKARF